MTDKIVVLEISAIEAAHLSGMVRQFVELLDVTAVEGATPPDPAVARLLPDAYADDADASEEFRRLTGSDLLDRRRYDADVVLATLSTGGPELDIATAAEEELTRAFVLTLDGEESAAWMRVLAAVRLVLASRLGIESDDDHDEDDPRFGVYDWLGFRLDGLVQAVEGTR